MFDSLFNLIPLGKKNNSRNEAQRNDCKHTRKRRLSLETLEDRELLSVNPFSPSDDDVSASAFCVPLNAVTATAAADAGDTISTAMDVTFENETFSITQVIGNGPYGEKDVDMYRFAVTEDDMTTKKVFTFDTSLPVDGIQVDTYLRLFDSTGKQIACNDDGNVNLYSKLPWVPAEAGTYYIGVSSFGNRSYDPNTVGSGHGGGTGDYTLTITLTELDGYNQHDLEKVLSQGLFSYAEWTDVGTEKQLAKIHAWEADLTDSIDLSDCTALYHLYCNNNLLTSLNVSGCTALEEIYCGNNALISLDVSGCTALKNIFCYGNPLDSLNLSTCTELSYLGIGSTKLFYTDVTLPDDFEGEVNQYDYAIGTNGVVGLTNTGYNELESFYDAGGGVTTYTWCDAEDREPIDSLLITNNKGVFTFDESLIEKRVFCIITNTAFENWTIETISVALAPAGFTYNVAEKAMVDHLKTFESDGLDVYADWKYDSAGKEMRLFGLECYRSGSLSLGALDFTGFDKLNKLDIYDVGATSLNLSGCTALNYLDCVNNSLTTLDVSTCPALQRLFCASNQLTSLNVSGCTKLKELSCDENKLSTLNVSGLTALKHLFCHANQLTTLKVAGCAALTELECYDNSLTKLNLAGTPLADHTSATRTDFSFAANAYRYDYPPTEAFLIVDKTVALDNDITSVPGTPVITAQPQPASYSQGAVATALFVEASGNGVLTYKWYKEGDALLTVLSTASTYTPSTTTVGSAGYYCVITNTLNGLTATVTSETATITTTTGGTVVTPPKKIIQNNSGHGATISGVKNNSKAATQTSLEFNWKLSGGLLKKHETADTSTILVEIYGPKPKNKGAVAPLLWSGTVNFKTFTIIGKTGYLAVEFTPTATGFQIKINGLNAGTKYTVQMQATDGNKYSKVTKVSATTKKYTAPTKVKKPTYEGTTVSLEWSPSTTAVINPPPGAVVVYEIGVYDKVSKTFCFGSDIPDGFTITAPSKELSKSLTAPLGKNTLGIRAVMMRTDNTVFVTSVIAKMNIHVK